MAHPIRVFCPGPQAPTPAAMMAFAASHGRLLTPHEEFREDDPASPDWEAMAFVWRPDRPPLFVELEWLDGPDARHLRAELTEARLALADLAPGPDRTEAHARLRDCRFVAGIAVSGEGLGDEDWRAADLLATCFEREARGLAWVVGRGFWLEGRPLA